MSSGARFKFQGSTFSLMTGFVGGSPLIDITGITKANPAVVTAPAHGRVDGDVVKLSEVGGTTEVNGKVFIINVLTGSTFELADTDSSAYTTYTSGGKMDYGTFSTFCELTNYNRTGDSAPEIPATSACSTQQEYEVGLGGQGTTQISFNFAPRTAVQTALNAWDISKDIMAFKIALPNSGGTMVQLGYVQQKSETAGVGGLWTGSFTMRNTGPRFDIS